MRKENWEAKLSPDDVITKTENGRQIKVVLLAGLQRLAREAGIKRSECKFNFITADMTGKEGIMQCVYMAEFDDGSMWVGAADCNSKNTTGIFVNYPTAVAESRAEARCLRKALGIRMLSAEEVGFQDSMPASMEVSPTKTIDPQVVKAIQSLCDSRKIPPAEVLESILPSKRSSSIYTLDQLNVEEGQAALSWLNSQKPKEIKSKTDERSDRKKALLAKKETS